MQMRSSTDIKEPRKGKPFPMALPWPYGPAAAIRQRQDELEPVSGALTHSEPHLRVRESSAHCAFANSIYPNDPSPRPLVEWGLDTEANHACVGFRVNSSSAYSLVPNCPQDLPQMPS